MVRSKYILPEGLYAIGQRRTEMQMLLMNYKEHHSGCEQENRFRL